LEKSSKKLLSIWSFANARGPATEPKQVKVFLLLFLKKEGLLPLSTPIDFIVLQTMPFFLLRAG